MKAGTAFPRIYLYPPPVDFRKSINGLLSLVEAEMRLSPFNPALFVFCNLSRDKLKALYWDQTGFCLWYKRLEKDRFRWPRPLKTSALSVSQAEWQWLLTGIDITQLKPHRPLDYRSVR